MGPRIGPIMIPIPQIDIARACRSGGLISSITDCDSGLMKAAAIPWRKRNATISSRFCAAPHAIEVRTKPTIAARNNCRRPIRSASQPVIGIATAEAMI